MSKIIRKVSLYVFIILSSLIFTLPFIWLLRSSFMETGQISMLPPEGIPKPFFIGQRFFVQGITLTGLRG